MKYSIVALDNGNVYVKASRNIITGTTKADQRKNITDFFNDLLEGNSSLDIQTVEGDVLTITKAETADKARDDYKTVQGHPVKMTDAEFSVKLRAEAHIDELAEISHKNNRLPVPDGKNHAFAKNGFTYRRAYFEDFDGQYYEITLSIGHNGTVATVYNVGKISKGALPSAKIIAVVGSKALGKTPSTFSLSKTTENVKQKNDVYLDAVSRGDMDMAQKLVDQAARNAASKFQREVTADLAGDYFFTNEDFIRELLAEDKSIFRQAWDEVKYLAKMATGSQQKRLLEQAKRYYQKAWNESKGEKNPTGEGGVQFSLYSRPDFTQKEWDIVNRRKYSEFDNPKYDLDENRKWMYANEKGTTVFAVYSKMDADNPTVLYGSRGEAAAKDHATVAAYLKGGRNVNRGRRTINRLLADIQRSEEYGSDGIANPEGTLSAIGNVQFPLRESGSYGRRDFGDGAEDFRQESVTEYDKEASDDSGASSFITFSNDYATIRNFMKEGDAPEIESVSMTEDGHPVAKDTRDEAIFSLSNDTAYMDKAISVNNSALRIDPNVMAEAKAVRDRVAERMNAIKDRGLVALPEDIEGNTYIANSSYDGTEENTTICPRSLASEAFVDAVSEYLGRPLTVEEQIYISQDLQGRSLTPECTYCYVATDRKAYRAFLGEYIKQRDAVLQKVKDDPNVDVSRNGKLYQEFLNGRKDTNPMYKRFKMWVDAYKNGTPMVDASHLANISKLMGDINSEFGGELKPQIAEVKKIFEEAYRAETKNPTGEGGKLSISRTQDMSWDDQINGALYGGKNIRRNDTLVAGYSADTPIGSAVDSKPLAIPLSILSKASSGKDISHSIKRGKLVRLDAGIKNAPITIVNPARNAIVYITDIKQGGLPIIAAFDMNTTFDGDAVHKATSIHLQVDVDALLRNLPETATVYVQKNELDPVGATNNLRGLAAKIKLIDKTISQKPGSVNGQFSLSAVDQAYTDAVNRGDMETVQKMVEQAARNAGYAVRAYHGSGEQFNSFSYGHIGTSTGVGILGEGFYFSDTKQLAKMYGKEMYDVYLRMENTYHATESDQYKINTADLIKQGYDSVDMTLGGGGKIYCVFDNTQMKSTDPVTYDNDGNVIPLSERFNTENNDIRYSLSEQGKVEDIAPVGGYRVYAKDIMLDKGDIAPLPGWDAEAGEITFPMPPGYQEQSNVSSGNEDMFPVPEGYQEQTANVGHIDNSGIDAGRVLDYDSAINETEGSEVGNERREETRESFHRRANAQKHTIRERGQITCGYNPALNQTERAGRTEEALQKLGIQVIVHEGLEINSGGITSIINGDSTSVAGDAVYVRNSMETDPMETAGHEAFHFWKHTDARLAYREVVEDNILFSSDAFIQFQQKIADQYFNEEVGIDDDASDKLSEEIFAYITGLIHAGDSDNIVRPFLRDYGAVKAAWETLVESQTQKTPTAENAEGVFFDGVASRGGNSAGGSRTTVEFPLPNGYAQQVNADDSTGAAPRDFDPVSHLQYEYGSLPEGENAVREDSLPKSTTGKDKVSLTARTVKGAQATPDELVDLLDKGDIAPLPGWDAEAGEITFPLPPGYQEQTGKADRLAIFRWTSIRQSGIL